MTTDRWTCNREFYDCAHRWRWQARLCQWLRRYRTRQTFRRRRALVSQLGAVRITRDHLRDERP